MPSVTNRIHEIREKLGDDGRVLVRYSGTEKKCRVMLEGKNETLIMDYANQIADEVRKEVGA